MSEVARLKPSRSIARLKPSRSDVACFLAALFLALVFLAFHLPYRPQSLEDVDSINFALGLRQFDVARHQPHPPGYPIFILIAKGARAVASSDAAALASISVAAGALGAIAIAALFALLRRDWSVEWTMAATAAAVTSPLYWLTAARPLSDSVGLSAAVAAQALTLAATTPRAIALAAFAAGLAIGIRSQVLWLTVPLLVFACKSEVRSLKSASNQPPVGTRQTSDFRLQTLLGLMAGVLTWLVPLVTLTGGPGAYWRAVSAQGSEDLGGIRMLWTTPTVRVLVDALYYALVGPWATWPIAIAVLTAAALGTAALLREDRNALAVIAVAFGPYLAFDILFQETFTIRYALPVVLPVAFLAVAGLRRYLPEYAAAIAIVALVMFDAHVGGLTLAAYSRQPAPPFRMLADMRTEADAAAVKPVLAPDRGQSFDLRRPLIWLADAAPRFDRQLPAPPQHEWLQAVKYWNAGGRAPVWFAVDPRRSAIELVQHGDPFEYRWTLPHPILMSGTRPSDADWYRVARPEWYLGEGWALTPEAAGVAQVDRRGLAVGAIEGWIRSDVLNGGSLMIGGRNFEPSGRVSIALAAGGTWTRILDAAPGFFLDVVRLPPVDLNPQTPEYVKLTVAAPPKANAAVEQFDISTARAVLGFGDGWFEAELNPVSGQRWRWLGAQGALRYLTPRGEWTLRLTGESPRRYYSRDSGLVVRSGDAVLASVTIGGDFSIDVPVPAALDPSTLIVETDQTHVPAENRWRRSDDRRRLGLRVFTCELRPRASEPGTTASSRPER